MTRPGRAGVPEHEGAPRQDPEHWAGARTPRAGGDGAVARLLAGPEGAFVPAAAVRELTPAGNGAVSRLLIARAAGDTATPTPGPTLGPVGAPAAGRPVGRYARVGRVDPFLSVRTEMDPREVTMLPDPLVADTVAFNDRVFVLEEYPQDWVKVRTDNGNIGYTFGKKLFVGMPDPQARLHQVESGETALGIAQRTYKCGEWGSDGRFFVNVLVAVNEASGDKAQQKGIFKNGGGDGVESWKDTELLAGYWIWLPSEEFARSLAGTVSSGSVSYEAWQQVEGLVGFAVGLLEGVASTLVDLVMGLVDLVSMIVDLVVDVARNGIAAKVGELRDFFDKLDVAEIASALWADFVQRWNAPDAYDRWQFRGVVVGMVLAEIALAVLTGGGTLAVKVAGKAGQLAKLAAKLLKLDAVTDFARGVDKAADATEAGRKARAVLRTAEPDAPATPGSRGDGGGGRDGGRDGGGGPGRAGGPLADELEALMQRAEASLRSHPDADSLAIKFQRAEKLLAAGDERAARELVKQIRTDITSMEYVALNRGLERGIDPEHAVESGLDIRPSWDPPAGARRKPDVDAPLAERQAWLQERVALHAREAMSRFATEGLTENQLRALEKNPGLAEAFRGSRIDAFAKETVQLDPDLADVICAPDFINEPDLISASLPDWFDMTTRQQWTAHLKTYGERYGREAGRLVDVGSPAKTP